MTDRRAPRALRPGRGAFASALTLALLLVGPAQADEATGTIDRSSARPANTLQSLAELDGKAPSRRQLNIQH